jgi:hypothetical protein
MTPTPAELFDRAARALYGDHYVAPMAFLLDVEKSIVSKWRNGKSRVPPGVWKTVATELLVRRMTVDETIAALGKWAREGLV